MLRRGHGRGLERPAAGSSARLPPANHSSGRDSASVEAAHWCVARLHPGVPEHLTETRPRTLVAAGDFTVDPDASSATSGLGRLRKWHLERPGAQASSMSVSFRGQERTSAVSMANDFQMLLRRIWGYIPLARATLRPPVSTSASNAASRLRPQAALKLGIAPRAVPAAVQDVERHSLSNGLQRFIVHLAFTGSPSEAECDQSSP